MPFVNKGSRLTSYLSNRRELGAGKARRMLVEVGRCPPCPSAGCVCIIEGHEIGKWDRSARNGTDAAGWHQRLSCDTWQMGERRDPAIINVYTTFLCVAGVLGQTCVC